MKYRKSSIGFMVLALIILARPGFAAEPSAGTLTMRINLDGTISYFRTALRTGQIPEPFPMEPSGDAGSFVDGANATRGFFEQQSSKTAASIFQSVLIPNEEATAIIRRSLLMQAKAIACDASILPTEVSATFSIGVSAGILVHGSGNVGFSATWDTKNLCK